MILDGASRRNLELDTNLAGGRDNTLQSVVDRCHDRHGQPPAEPLAEPPAARPAGYSKAARRSIACLLDGYRFETLQPQPQGDRRYGADPRAYRPAQAPGRVTWRACATPWPPCPSCRTPGHPGERRACSELAGSIRTYPELADLLARAIIDTPPAVIRDGGVIKPGYDAELDELQAAERERRPVPDGPGSPRKEPAPACANLKVGYNRVHGYFIELPSKQAEQAPADYIRRQTLKGAERFITPELEGLRGQGAVGQEPRPGPREDAL